MNIGNSPYQDLSSSRWGVSQATSTTTKQQGSTGTFTIFGASEDALFANGNREVKYADHSTEENPVMEVIHKSEDGFKSVFVNINEVDPRYCSRDEVEALLCYQNGQTDIRDWYIPPQVDEVSYTGKQNWVQILENTASTLRSIGAINSANLAQTGADSLKNFINQGTSQTSTSYGNEMASMFSMPSVTPKSVDPRLADLQEQLASLISGYDRSTLEKVLENEDETQFWEELFAKVDENQEGIKKSIKENAEKQLEQQWEQDKIIRQLMGQMDTDFSENVSRSALLGAVT